MPIERIRIEGLRILTGVDCRLDPHRNYFLGPNGAGKTSLLEAVYLLARGRSFRTRQTKRLIQHGRSEASVFAEVAAGEAIHRLGVSVSRARVELRLDHRPARGTAALARLLPAYVIDPSVHALIEAGPSERRRFLDWGVFHVEPTYLEDWKRYRRVLSQRNAALKQHATGSALATWDRALIEAADPVHQARARYAARLAPEAAAVGQRLLGRPLEIDYRPGWRSGLCLREALAEAGERDRDAAHTQVGPHRADLTVTAAGSTIEGEASRGQQKLAAAGLVLAQIREAADAGRPPGVLLVDDPAAELDEAALVRLLAELTAVPGQLVLTGLSAERLLVDPRFPVFHVEQGMVRRCYNGLI